MTPIVFQKNLLNTLILFLLHHKGPMHGYAIAQCLEEKFDWKTSQTTIYNILKILESDDLLTVEEQTKNGRIQKIYAISDAGLAHLKKTKHAQARQFKKMVSKLLVLMYRYKENEISSEEEVANDILDDLMPKLKDIYDCSMSLMETAPKETLHILKRTLEQLQSLATEKDTRI